MARGTDRGAPGRPAGVPRDGHQGLEIDTYDGTVVVSATGAIESVRCASVE